MHRHQFCVGSGTVRLPPHPQPPQHNCRGISDVSGLEHQCGSLQSGSTPSTSGSASDCDGISDMLGLGQCGALHTLDLSGCIGISDVSGLGQCDSLHTLNLNGCHNVNDVSRLGQCVIRHRPSRSHTTTSYSKTQALLQLRLNS
eukprot:TRINITY_DN18825_c0_g1_i1.p1 TRINITY_DN18825_c0_g1~~TRINITY_DN18825_c0_g1_i1.p1  ORF type:complete len:144 (-),score=10.78 TRINITY_DN18825_c0_g1_i1:334-765(-)